MNILSSYLEKIHSLLKDKGLERSIVARSVSEIVPSIVEEKQIRITSNIAYIKGSSSLKNAIFLKKEEIIEKCLEGGAKISDLR